MPNNNIVVIGSCMIDFVCYVDRLPKHGETVVGSNFCTNFGGKGSNQCVAAAKLGGNTLMIARVGDDLWGEKYLQNFKDVGVDHRFVKKTLGFTNGIAQISVAKNAENQIVIVPGANTELSETDVENAKEEIENAAVVVCQLETPITSALKAIKLTKGISILNGAPGLNDFPIELLTTPSIFCVNESEAELFSKLPITSIDEALIAAKKFIGMGCKTIIITLGGEGSVYMNNDGSDPEHVICPKVNAVDTTGAGDAFVGALAYFIASEPGLSLKEAILKAGFVASKSTTLPGTQISYPNKNVLDEIKSKNLL
ncbi:ribokinase [Onthophagus taurus]|uniref:ribokinase n=1 Tax=Onthophagus taurus TaxID=166361 RepID=UPI000C204958|nr:ribokinase [Onthophagus taurus]XP_022916658.1 ribokinase [Onthophagus taurus]